MESTQSFKNKIMRELYPHLNNNSTISEEFLRHLNNSKMDNLADKLADLTNNININESNESFNNSYSFFRSLVEDKKVNESMGFGDMGSGAMHIPYCDLIADITNCCRNTLRSDFQQFAKIHDAVKAKLAECNVLTKNGVTVQNWLLNKYADPGTSSLPIQSNHAHNEKLKSESKKEEDELLSKVSTLTDKTVNQQYIYMVTELTINKIRQIILTLPFNVSTNNVDFLMNFYHTNLTATSMYLSMGSIEQSKLFEKMAENLFMIFSNNAYFTHNIKVLDRNSNQDILKLVSSAILKFTKDNAWDIQSTGTKALCMIDFILANIQNAASTTVKISLATFDYIIMQFINAYKSRMQCVGLMHVFSILRSLNGTGMSHNNASCHGEERVTSLLLNSGISDYSTATKVCELEYLLIHRVLNAALRNLTVSDVQIDQKLSKIDSCMSYVIFDLTAQKKAEYLNKYRDLLKIKITQYPLSCTTDIIDGTLLKFWWINPQEKLEEKQIKV